MHITSNVNSSFAGNFIRFLISLPQKFIKGRELISSGVLIKKLIN